MSTVTNFIVTAACGDEGTLRNDGRFSRVDQYSGGSKVFEAPVWLAALNHCDEEEVLRYIFSQRWRDRDSVQVFVQRQEENLFTVEVADPE